MTKFIKYKDLIKKMQPFENDDVVMVAVLRGRIIYELITNYD